MSWPNYRFSSSNPLICGLQISGYLVRLLKSPESREAVFKDFSDELHSLLMIKTHRVTFTQSHSHITTECQVVHSGFARKHSSGNSCLDGVLAPRIPNLVCRKECFVLNLYNILRRKHLFWKCMEICLQISKVSAVVNESRRPTLRSL